MASLENSSPKRPAGKREIAALLEAFGPLLPGREIGLCQEDGRLWLKVGEWTSGAVEEAQTAAQGWRADHSQVVKGNGRLATALATFRCYPLASAEAAAGNGMLVVRAGGDGNDEAIEKALHHSLLLLLAQAAEKRAVASETLERYRELSLVYRVSETIGASLDPETIPRLVLAESNHVIKADAGAIILFGSDIGVAGDGTAGNSRWEMLAHFGEAAEVKHLEQLLPGLVPQALGNARPLTLNRLPLPGAQPAAPGALLTPLPISASGALLWAPLKTPERVLGGILLLRQPGRPIFTASDEKLLVALAIQSAFAMENAQLFGNLRRSLDGTLEMKNLMDDIFASIPSGVITTDLAHDVTVFNRSAERILDTPAFEVVGQPLWHVVPTIFPHIQAILEQGQVLLNKEFSLVVPERGRVHLRLSCTPLRDAYGGIKGSTIVLHDLTEQRQVEAEREWIRQTLGRVVALRVRDRLLADPGNLRLDGIRQPITVLFADIHQFTSFSERMAPEILFRILNSYLSLAAQAVLEQEGTLDKFMGDAVMAFWNAPDTQPDHALRAVRAAVAITQAIHKLHNQLSEDRRLYFSVGVHTGEAMVGNVGTSELFNYTVIGDTVNLAQRLEAVGRPGQILLSEDTYRAVAPHVIAREMPPVLLRGRQQPVVVYELEGLVGRAAFK